MKARNAMMVRVYLTEGEQRINDLLKLLRDWEHVRGVTVFRGIAGYGRSGRVHDAGLLDLSADLPLVLEFFDEPERVEHTIRDLNEIVAPGHVVTWPVTFYMEE